MTGTARPTPYEFIAHAVATDTDPYLSSDRHVSALPMPRLAAMLDTAEAAWRVAVTLDGHDGSEAYRAADAFLSSLLVLAFGHYDGPAVRDEMADNFEGWSYNRKVIVDRRDRAEAEVAAEYADAQPSDAAQDAALAAVAEWMGRTQGLAKGPDGLVPTGYDAAFQARGPQLVRAWDWTTVPTAAVILEGIGGEWAYEVTEDETVAEAFAEAGVYGEPYAGWALCLFRVPTV